MEYTTALLVLALVFGFYMAWNIGANDVANAMGTSVGSGALTFKRAVILAAILEFAGAFFVGSSVSETVRKGIVDPVLFEGDPQAFVLGMLSALLAAGVWLQIASYFGWPVSTTHSIVGAIVGFGVVYGGLSAVEWGGVSKIAASWVISPLMSGTISFIIFQIVLHRVFYRADPVKAVRKFTPYMVFIVLGIITLTFRFQ
jgi:PiT family inorganic phosphate transporter